MLTKEYAEIVNILLGLATHDMALQALTSQRDGLDISRWDTCFLTASIPNAAHVPLLDNIVPPNLSVPNLLANMKNMTDVFRAGITRHALETAQQSVD